MNTSIELNQAEQEVLSRLLEQAIADVRVGVRRSRAPEFHDHLRDEEGILKGMLAKLRQDSAPQSP